MANDKYTIEIENVSYDLNVDNIIIYDYSYATNKPKINSVELSGNVTPAQLGLATSTENNQKENLSNKVITITSTSTDTQYPSAKCLYDNLSAKVNCDLDNLSVTGCAILDAKANIDLSNLSATGESHFANCSLSNLSETGQALFNGFADSSLSNLSSSGKSEITGYAMPDYSNPQLTSMTNNTIYQANQDSVLIITIGASNGNKFVYLSADNTFVNNITFRSYGKMDISGNVSVSSTYTILVPQNYYFKCEAISSVATNALYPLKGVSI